MDGTNWQTIILFEQLVQVLCFKAFADCYDVRVQSRPGHPYRQFSWGNKKSLWDQPLAAGLNIRQHIRDYYV